MNCRFEHGRIHIDVERSHALTISQPGHIGNDGFHEKNSVIIESLCDILKTSHLLMLRHQVEQRIEYQETKIESPIDIDVGKVANRNRDAFTALFRQRLLKN